ncbi:nucleotidyl transferase AbiEii/AbiGii toxin family protein [Evansella sp. AB-P1]|uniref:nucleotidyl transferase AbiEii/AbiGii toxin family protein n=1 Tax=Evansella sp. AB-P1 TaxID=3037653 RepID=UPI00241DB55E|nr:nucleotidyl transferase AbiEii/AbiGii toxin family protein [Evansella sp. AB-P1]MDG5788348.1 nucleotidyl transferase AbiEii/AbiGii toxin family protein [Evansella sp. AB-P1]
MTTCIQGQYDKHDFPLQHFTLNTISEPLLHVLSSLILSHDGWALKGGVATSIYVEDHLREVTDLDILIHKDNIKKNVLDIIKNSSNCSHVFEESYRSGRMRYTAFFPVQKSFVKTEWILTEELPSVEHKDWPINETIYTLPCISRQSLIGEKIFKIAHSETNSNYKKKFWKHLNDVVQLLPSIESFSKEIDHSLLPSMLRICKMHMQEKDYSIFVAQVKEKDTNDSL